MRDVRHRLFTFACAASALLWLAWLVLGLLHSWRFPLEINDFVVSLAGLAVLWFLPVLWVHVRERDRDRAINAGFCVACGYNLTGNTSGVCPECGTAIAEKRSRGSTDD